MGTGSAAPRAPGKTGDEPREAETAGFRQPERAARDRGAIPAPPGPPDDEHDREEQPAGAGAEPHWDRVVPPYVDDRATRGRQQREPEPQPAGADEPDDDAARAGATAGPAASGTWSAWSSEAGEHEAGARGDDAAAETADHAEPGEAVKPSPGGEALSRAERPDGADGPGETAGRIAEAQGAAEPGGTRDAADPGNAPGAGDAGDPGESGGAADGGADGSTSLDDEVAVVPGVPRYHRRGCILIRFLSDGDLETTTRREAEAAGSVSCKACQADKPAATD
jgi:hypothetical protein